VEDPEEVRLYLKKADAEGLYHDLLGAKKRVRELLKSTIK